MFWLVFFRMKATQQNFQEIMKVSDTKPVVMLLHKEETSQLVEKTNLISNFERAEHDFENDTSILLADLNCSIFHKTCRTYDFILKFPCLVEIIKNESKLIEQKEHNYEDLLMYITDLKKLKLEHFKKSKNISYKNKNGKSTVEPGILFNPNHKYFKKLNQTEEKMKMRIHQEQVREERVREEIQKSIERKKNIAVAAIIFGLLILTGAYICLYIKRSGPKLD